MNMMGSCKNYLLVCPMCGKIFGGVTSGGIRRYCKECPYQGMCELSDFNLIGYVEEVCSNEECKFEWFIYNARLKGLNV